MVGKLYRVLSRNHTRKVTYDGLGVYREPKLQSQMGSQLSWRYIKPDNIIMWLGTPGCSLGWAKVLYIDKVWYVFLEGRENLKRLERVLL